MAPRRPAPDGHLAVRTVNDFATRTGWLHPRAVTYAKDGIGLVAIVLAVGWWFARDMDDTDTAAALLCTVVGVFVALAAAQLLGHVVDRARPHDVIDGVRVLVSRTKDFSFPSDHATVAGAVAGGLWIVDRRLGRVAVGLAYVGAHYPADVLAGLALGALVAFACVRGLRSPLARILDRSATMALEPLIRRRRPDAERV